MTNIRQYYKILGVSRWASDSKLQKAYHQKAKLYHPDISKNDKNSAEKFNKVKEAYEAIVNMRKSRKQKIENILKPLRKVWLSRKKTGEMPIENPPMRGNDIFCDVYITFEESALGCKKDLILQRLVRCDCSKEERPHCKKCNGSGKYLKSVVIKLTLTKGIFDMQTLKIKGKGSEGEENAENGDLIVNVHVLPSKTYERRGLDVYTRLVISYPEAVLGTTKLVPTIYGDVECKIPHGIDSGAKLQLTAKGMLDETTGEIGNQYVIVRVDIPKSYTQEQKELLEEFTKTI